MGRTQAPEIGTAIKETKITETIPGSQPKNSESKWASWPEGKKPGFWQYIDSRRSSMQWLENYIRLGRYEGADSAYLDSFDGQRLAEMFNAGNPFSVEFIAKEYGGGKYSVYLKENGEIQYGGYEFKVIGEPKDPGAHASTQTNGNGGGENGALAQVLNRLVDLIERRDNPAGGAAATNLIVDGARGAMDIQRTAYQVAAQTLATGATAGVPSRSEALMDKFMEAIIIKMMNPTDPIETFAKMMTAMKGMGVMGSGARESTLATIMQTAPALLDKITTGLGYYAQIQKIQLDAALLNRGLPPAPAVAQPPSNPNVQPPVTAGPQAVPPIAPHAQAPPAAAAPPDASGREPWQDVLEMQVMNILLDTSLSVQDCVSEVMTCCDRIDPRLAEMLVAHGEPGMEIIFAQGPHLPCVPKDARLKEFMRLFMADVQAARTAPAAPAGPILVPAAPPSAQNGMPAQNPA
jgi:hypothetical protein